MSKKTDQFEQDIVSFVSGKISYLPSNLPQWMLDLSIKPGARITDVSRKGSSGSKTDIIIRLEDSVPIKISTKLSSADYFGNWYSHKRILKEFGREIFDKLVYNCTIWANKWKFNPNASLFVGVSVCFGKRTGDTAQEFTEIFQYEDIKKVVAGVGTSDDIANCLYISSKVPNNINELIYNLKPINKQTILELSRNFKIVYRPINPMTERTNRGKCIYTQFRPYKRLPSLTTITSLPELTKLGTYIEVDPSNLNHNELLNKLEEKYNIKIPRKQ